MKIRTASPILARRAMEGKENLGIKVMPVASKLKPGESIFSVGKGTGGSGRREILE